MTVDAQCQVCKAPIRWEAVSPMLCASCLEKANKKKDGK